MPILTIRFNERDTRYLIYWRKEQVNLILLSSSL